MQATATSDVPWHARWMTALLCTRGLVQSKKWRTMDGGPQFIEKGAFGFVAANDDKEVQLNVLCILEAMLCIVFEAWEKHPTAIACMRTLPGKETPYMHGVACVLSVYAQLVLEQEFSSHDHMAKHIEMLLRDLHASEAGLFEHIENAAKNYFPLS